MASGVSGAGFTTAALPARSEAASFTTLNVTGKLAGEMHPTTPTGRRATSALRWGSSRPLSDSIDTPASDSNHPVEIAISARASASGFPCSRVNVVASDSA